MRDFKKEAEWERQAYKRYTVKFRKDNGDNDRFVSVLNGQPFSEWVKKHVEKDYNEIQDKKQKPRV